ncbi:MAG: MFS transporter [Candidatus Hodarchaeales archaeon]|jgi:DHA1 family bicyclomycin/chloramphenicol resistance-like MFS transporter
MIQNTEETQPRGLFIPSLIISACAIQPAAILVSLLLIDVGNTFNQSVGIMGQIQTASSILGVITALLMGVWSVRYKRKTLLIVGLTIYGISAVGCFLAPNFIAMLIVYALSGAAVAMVLPMVYALIGDHLPLEKRAGSIGIVLTGLALFSIVSTLIIGFVASIVDWQIIFLVYIIPIAFLSIMIVIRGIPSSSGASEMSQNDQVQFWDGIKGIFSNRSAVACQGGNIFSTAVWLSLVLYISSFFRDQFGVPVEVVSIIFILAALGNIMGNLLASKFVKKYGKKPITVSSSILVGVFIAGFLNMPILELALVTGILVAFFAGIFSTTFISLSLEQVPQFRGSMMSLNSASSRVGEAIGAGLGGILLVLYNYEMLGLALGLMSFIASIIFYFFVIDPATEKME